MRVAFVDRRNYKRKTTPVGFEPTRGDPIGLAGRRLNRSAKVSFNPLQRSHARKAWHRKLPLRVESRVFGPIAAPALFEAVRCSSGVEGVFPCFRARRCRGSGRRRWNCIRIAAAGLERNVGRGTCKILACRCAFISARVDWGRAQSLGCAERWRSKYAPREARTPDLEVNSLTL